jgi:hypothetical protein
LARVGAEVEAVVEAACKEGPPDATVAQTEVGVAMEVATPSADRAARVQAVRLGAVTVRQVGARVVGSMVVQLAARVA